MSDELLSAFKRMGSPFSVSLLLSVLLEICKIMYFKYDSLLFKNNFKHIKHVSYEIFVIGNLSESWFHFYS